MDNDPIADWLETCEDAARAGGQQLLNWRGKFKTRQKGRKDLVTDADLASQSAIESLLRARFPEYRFVGEEQGKMTHLLESGELTWIVDPLDGTTNYVHGYPNYGVSVAIAHGADVLAGVIYDPLRDQCFAAGAGRGAFCNGARLHVSATATLADSLVAVSLPAHVERNSPDLLDFIEVVQLCQAVRRSGSAALNLAHVADGSLDAFWAAHIHPWDVAAGVLLIREAGGYVTGRNGKEFDLWHPHFVAASCPSLHGELLASLQGFR